MRMSVAALLGLLLVGGAEPAPAQVPGTESFYARCEQAGRMLWGRSLCAPIVAVDPGTGRFRTSQAAPGPLPVRRGNTAFDWAGTQWIMILDPVPASAEARDDLLFHEAFHAVQEALGFPANTAVAGHLSEPNARYLIRLEWNALARALASSGRIRRNHVAQALAFRARRHASFPSAAVAERDQMRHEGLAAYTGARLSGAPAARAAEMLGQGPARPSLERSFAYISAPAWGLLLDGYRPGWRQAIRTGGDLPDLVPFGPATMAKPDDYGGFAILSEEHRAALERRVRLQAALEATAPARSLRLPLARMNMNFDPNQVMTAPDGSIIYPQMELSDRWGRVRAVGPGLRIASDYTAAFAPWPASREALQLAPGWRIEERPDGSARLVSAQP